ncbi:MAG: hypothetical protein AAB787_00770 [Patescibacteria group bacterium]
MPAIATKRKTGTKNLRALIFEAAQEILSDPDFALELSDSVKKRLKVSRTKSKTKSLSEIKKKYF